MDKYNLKPVENALVVYDKFRAGLKSTQDILQRFNEGEIDEEVLSEPIKECYQRIGKDAFFDCLKGKITEELEPILAAFNLDSQKIRDEIVFSAEQRGVPPFNYELLVLEQLTELFNSFPTNYFYCSIRQDFSGVKGYQFLKLDRGAQLFTQILPPTECSFYITKNNSDNLIIHNFHHDTGKNGEMYILAPLTVENIAKLYAKGFRMRTIMENCKTPKDQKCAELIYMALKNNDSEGLSAMIRNGVVLGQEELTDGGKKCLQLALESEAVEALEIFLEETSYISDDLLGAYSHKLRAKNSKFNNLLKRFGY